MIAPEHRDICANCGLPTVDCPEIGWADCPPAEAPKRRLKACVEAWPDADTGAYDPACCRFPKSCSATIYDPAKVSDADLEDA